MGINPDDVLKAVAHVQDGHQLLAEAASERWYETTDDIIPLASDYELDSYVAGWDTAAYALGNNNADASAPDALDFAAYVAGLIAAVEVAK